VALYTDRRVSLGAVSAAMIATSGDEAFVMLAMFPFTALAMTLALSALGILAGWLTDRIVEGARGPLDCGGFSVHDDDACDCFPGRGIAHQWRRPASHRLALVVLVLTVGAGVTTGALGPAGWEAERFALLALIAFGLFVVVTVPDHFLDEHLWNHVVREHVPRIFLWTLAAFAAVTALVTLGNVAALVQLEPWPVLALAAALGVIPESGPHLMFSIGYAQHALPLSILVANSAVQDGHGMLPLLAHSRGDFLKVKAVNLAFGLAAGALLLALGT
jgi:hypothetical protein